MAYSTEVIKGLAGSARARLLERFQDDLQTNQYGLEKFARDLVTNPAYQVRWADAMFMYAAKIEVAHQVIELLNHRQHAFEIREQLQENIVNAARYVFNKSTSPSSNYTAECSLSARCEALDRFQHIDDLDATKL